MRLWLQQSLPFLQDALTLDPYVSLASSNSQQSSQEIAAREGMQMVDIWARDPAHSLSAAPSVQCPHIQSAHITGSFTRSQAAVNAVPANCSWESQSQNKLGLLLLQDARSLNLQEMPIALI